MESASKIDESMEGLIEVFMTGGPPWGFKISGGSEFGTKLFVEKVAEDGIGRKMGDLHEGDNLVYINGVSCTSRAKAIDSVKMGKNELRLQLRRNHSTDTEGKTIKSKTGPKRTNSFYGSVMENMLENVSNDISSTHYSRRRNTLEKEMAVARKKQAGVLLEEEIDEKANEIIRENRDDSSERNGSPTKIQLKALSPTDEKARLVQNQASPRNVQRVKIKSVNVKSVVPGVRSDISEQLKNKIGTSESRSEAGVTSPSDDDDVKSSLPKSQVEDKEEKVMNQQTKSMDEGTPMFHQSWNDPPCLKKTNPPPVAAKPTKTRLEGMESGNELPAMSVSKAKAMFERLSKSQENLDTLGSKEESKSSPDTLRKDMPVVRTKRIEDRKDVTKNLIEESRRNSHTHTKSLPSETFEVSRREFRRPGSAPNRRSNRQIRPKSAHFASEEEKSREENLPLGYAAVSSSNRLVHGRKSIASCAPSSSDLYRNESSFRHSSEDLRPSIDSSARWEKKSATLPANQMREAAMRFHKELMKKDPKFRYSLNATEIPSRPGHLGSFTGGSSGSSIGSSQDQLNNADSLRRLSGPNVFTRACSTSSLDSSPGTQDALASPSEEENTILSRLLREQRLNNNGNLNRIEEEARSPRSKISPREGSLTSSETVVSKDENSGKRTISIQTEFVPELPTKRELSVNRSTVNNSYSATILTRSSIETCIDDVDPAMIDNSTSQRGSNDRQSEGDQVTRDVSHAKQPSTDSIDELNDINETREGDDSKKAEDGALTDIDALPPPPDELLVASPPEKEKPQRVINRKKRDHNSTLGASRNSSCVSTDSNMSTCTMDSGIGVRAYSMSDMSPRNSPTRVNAEFDDYYNHAVDEGFKGSREELDDQNECPNCNSGSMTPTDELESTYAKPGSERSSTPNEDTIEIGQNESIPESVVTSPRIEELDQKKSTLIESMRKKIEELKSQEQEIAEEIKMNEELGKRVRDLVEKKATQTEFSKYELFIGELNKIVSLLLSLTQRLHRYEQMLQDLDMSEEEDKQKRDTLISRIDKLRSQHEEACHLREVNDKRGENVANFLDKYFDEEEFADFQYYVDMKSQLALMQSEIKEKVKLGEERYQALDNTGMFQ